MFNRQSFKKLLVQYICGIIGWALLGCTAISLMVMSFMIIGMLAGEWAFLHVLAMLGMTTGFAMLAAIFIALHTAAGGWFFGTEEKHAKTVD